jgi:bifunctional DNase/RNase
MEKHELAVVGLSQSESSPGYFALILEAIDTQQRLPVIIGEAAAQSIAMVMENMHPSRPLTHDLLASVLSALAAELREVVIYEMRQEVLLTELHLRNSSGQDIRVEANCSDAIALAIRTHAPIYTYTSILSLVSIEADFKLERVKRGSLRAYSLQELEELQEKLLAKEDYKSAARIRDLIQQRRQQDKRED